MIPEYCGIANGWENNTGIESQQVGFCMQCTDIIVVEAISVWYI
jgi:hypothetical protein